MTGVHTDGVERVRREVESWLAETLPPGPASAHAASVKDWQSLFFSAGWATPGWPVEYGGRGLEPAQVAAVNVALAAARAPVPYYTIPVLMVGSVLQRLGTEEQRRRLLPAMATGSLLWCQLFSEPGAGSDLASLSTRAVATEGGWIVSGQKVWSSFARDAGRGLLLARTDPIVPKHAGLTAFALDMGRPGVDVRPLKQMTGDASFCEVFLDDVFVPDADRIGEVNAGWLVAQAVLEAERNMQGGTGTSPVARVGGVPFERLAAMVGDSTSEELRCRLLDLWVRDRATSLAVREYAREPRMAPVIKVAQGECNQAIQELAVDLLGADAVGFDDGGEGGELLYGYLRSKANTIGGGTSEILRTVIGERLLGLPKEPDPYRGIAWEKVPRS